ncbi:magnesium chelatase domain-containing protein [Nocardia takedensis]
MIDTFAWSATPTSDGGADLALIATGAATALDTVATTVPAHPMLREPRDRVRAALYNSDAAYPSEPYSLYRVGGATFSAAHDLAAALAIYQLATDPPWQGLLDQVLFIAELNLDGSLRPRLTPEALAGVIAAAHRAEFRYVVTASPADTEALDRLDALTVVTPADLEGVLNWLDAISRSRPIPASTRPDSPGMRIARQYGPEMITGLRAARNSVGVTAPPVTGDSDPIAHPRIEPAVTDSPKSLEDLRSATAHWDAEINDLYQRWEGVDEVDAALGTAVHDAGRAVMGLLDDLYRVAAGSDPLRSRQLGRAAVELHEALEFSTGLDDYDYAACLDIHGRLAPAVALAHRVVTVLAAPETDHGFTNAELIEHLRRFPAHEPARYPDLTAPSIDAHRAGPGQPDVAPSLHPDHVRELRSILRQFESIDPLRVEPIDAAEQRLSDFIRDHS